MTIPGPLNFNGAKLALLAMLSAGFQSSPRISSWSSQGTGRPALVELEYVYSRPTSSPFELSTDLDVRLHWFVPASKCTVAPAALRYLFFPLFLPSIVYSPSKSFGPDVTLKPARLLASVIMRVCRLLMCMVLPVFLTSSETFGSRCLRLILMVWGRSWCTWSRTWLTRW